MVECTGKEIIEITEKINNMIGINRIMNKDRNEYMK